MTLYIKFLLAMVLVAAPASALRGLLAGNCVDDTSMPTNYGERPVSSHAKTCDQFPNTNCWGTDGGCSLWASALDRCKEPHQKDRCDKLHYIYEGSATANHVIMVPTIPTRGIEDIETNDFQAATKTANMWSYFWDDSVSNKSGGDGQQGFDPAKGALVINVPWFREYHQMHIHAGTRNAAFNKCVNDMKYGKGWRSLRCTNLNSGGTAATQANLYYTTVHGLGGVWDTYKDGMSQGSLIQTTIPKQDRKYHVGVIATVSAALRGDEFFVILYAPVAAADKLGRGHFLNGS